MGTGEVVDEGDLGALEEGQGNRVDEGRLAVGLDTDVVRLGGLDQLHAVLEAGAAAAVDGDTQQDRMALGPGERGQAGGRAGGQAEAMAAGVGRDLEGGDGLDGAHGALYEARTGDRKARPAK